MSDLHAAGTHRLAELRAVAKAAIEAEASGIGWGASGALVEYIATWHPDQALRWLEWAEDVARRHKPVDTIDGLEGGPWCAGCSIVDYESGDVATVPFERCADYRGLARALDIEVSG